MARKKHHNCGIFRVDDERNITETISYFEDMKTASFELVKLRKQETDAGNDQYKVVILPCGPNNEGLLPPWTK